MAGSKRPDLNPKQQLAMSALVAGATNEEAAQIAGVTVTRVRAWKRADNFAVELRRTMERFRQECEANILIRVRRSMATIDQMQEAVLPDGNGGTRPDMEMRALAAKLILGSGTRMISRYKELHVEGYSPPPLFVLPAGTRIGTVRVLPEIPPPPRNAPIVDATATVIDDDDDGDPNTRK